MEKFSFKDVLILFAGLFITAGIAYAILTITGFIPLDIAKLFYEGAFVGQRNISVSYTHLTLPTKDSV